MGYGAVQRLEEQVSILVADASTTAIVAMSMLGEEAVPFLLKALEAEGEVRDGERGLSTEQADAIVRALGMLADPRAVPLLAKRLREAEEEGRSWRPEATSLRITVNALRKVGTPEALNAILTRLAGLEPQHAASVVRSFGEKGKHELVALLEPSADKNLVAAIAAATVLRIPDAVTRLLHLVQNPPSQDVGIMAAWSLGAFEDVPPAHLENSLRKVLATKRSSQPYYERSSGTIWERQEFRDALVAALYHTQGVKVTPRLLELATTKPKDDEGRSDSARDRLVEAIVSFGPPALPFVEGSAIEKYEEPVRALATEVAHRIRKGDKGSTPQKAKPGERPRLAY